MNYAKMVEYIQSFNGKRYQVKNNSGNQALTSKAAYDATLDFYLEDDSAGTGEVLGKLSPNDTRPDYYAKYKYNFDTDNKRFGIIVLQHSTITSGSDVRAAFIGPSYIYAVVDGKNRMFAVKGGGLDEGDASVKTEIQYVVEKMNIDDIFEPIQKAFGIELLTEVSDEAKAWVRDIDNIWNMHEGYREIVDGEVVEHQPFDYPTFDTVADNIYVRMCINDSNLVMDADNSVDVDRLGRDGSSIFVYVDPYEEKTYFPYDLIQTFSDIIDTCNGFSTSDTNISGNLAVGVHPTFTKTWYVWNNANTVSTKTFNEIINSRVGGRPAVWQYPNVGSTTATLRIWCSDNGKIGRIYNGSSGSSSNYNYYNAMSGGSAQAGPWTRYSLTLTRQNSSADSPWVLSSETIATGSISEINGYSGEYFSGNVDGSNIGYAKSSNLIGTKPRTPSNIQSSYATWYNNSVGLVCYESYPFDDNFNPLDYKLVKRLLAMSIGEDAGAGKTQTDVQGGTTRGEDLDEDSGDGSEKLIIEDEGSTDNASIPDTVGIGSGIYHVYATEAHVLDSLYERIYTNHDVGDIIAKFYSGDLSKAIIDIYRLPFNVLNGGSDATAIKVADISYTAEGGTAVAKEYSNRIKTLHFGSLSITPKFNDQRDYSPITRCTLFLPFSGYHEISIDDIMNATVRLEAKVDIISGSGSYNVFVERNEMNALMYTYSFNCRADFPLTGEAHRTFLDTMLGLAKYTAGATIGSAAGGALGMVAGGASVMGAATLAKPIPYNGGNIGSIGGWLSILTPFIMIDRPNYGEPEHFREIMGEAANTDVRLGLVHGYTEIREVHVDSIDEATAWEKDEIGRLLKSGVIL